MLESEEDEEAGSAGINSRREPRSRVFAKYGARGIVTDGPMQKLRELLAEHVSKDSNAVVRVVATGNSNVRVECCSFQAPGHPEGDLSGANVGPCKNGQCPLTCSTKWEGAFSSMQA